MTGISTALRGAALLLAFGLGGHAAAAETPSLQLSKVVMDTETSEVTAKVKGGTLCVFPSKIKLTKEKKTQDYERFDNLFTSRLKSSGFSVVSTSGDMFASDNDDGKGDYLVGVILRPTAVNICSSVSGFKGNYSLTAEWQIYDRAAGKVVETVTTTGLGAQEKFAADGLEQMVNQAFTASLGALVEKGVMQKYVGSGGSE